MNRENSNSPEYIPWKPLRVAPGRSPLLQQIIDKNLREAPLRPNPDIWNLNYPERDQLDEPSERPNPDIWSPQNVNLLNAPAQSLGGLSTIKTRTKRIKKRPTFPATVNEDIDVHAEPTIIKDKNVNPKCLQPGNVYIINTLRFKDPSLSERHGSLVDVARLQQVLSKFHMNVDCITDAKLKDVRSRMEKISTEKFEEVSCLMVVIMSHGYEGNMIAAKDGTYSLCHDVLYPILRNKSLEPKLKIIVTQACKGPVDAMTIQTEGPRPNVIPSEILQLYSCVEGFVSYLNTKKGSVFINTFCDNLEKHGFEKDIFEIALKVVADVKERYGNAQIPTVHSNATIPIVLGDYVPISKARKDQHDTCSSEDE